MNRFTAHRGDGMNPQGSRCGKSVCRRKHPDEIRGAENRNALEPSQREQMALVPGHDGVGLASQSAFKNHLVVRVRRGASGTLVWKYQGSGIGQCLRPGHGRALRVVASEFLHCFVVLRQQCGADEGFAATLRPSGKAVKGRTLPEGRAGNDIGVENDFHGCVRLRTRWMAAATASSFLAINGGRSRPARRSERTRAGVSGRRLRKTTKPLA